MDNSIFERCIQSFFIFDGTNNDVQNFLDSNMEGDRDGGRSTISYFSTIGGTTISWVPKIQQVVVSSTIEMGYVVAIEARK